MLKQIKINDTSHTFITREKDPDEKWDANSTDTSHNIQSFSVARKNEYFDFVTDICVVPGRKYTLIYVLYSTGDSFCNIGGEIDFIGLYDTEDNTAIIHENVCKLQEVKGSSVTLTAENGEKYEYGIPWQGYFERLETVESIEIYEKEEMDL